MHYDLVDAIAFWLMRCQWNSTAAPIAITVTNPPGRYSWPAVAVS